MAHLTIKHYYSPSGLNQFHIHWRQRSRSKSTGCSSIIETVHYPEYAAPIFPVLKGVGKAIIRGAHTLSVNKAIRTNLYPIPRIEDLCAALSGLQLNLKHSYNHIRLHEMPRVFTTINTCRRLYVYTKLPFGVSSTRGIFQC